jgi:hypothetical protein
MGFETYIPQRGPSSGKSTIRILKNGDFSISPALLDEHFGKANYVELMYNPQSKKIGLKPRTKSTKATYKLRESPQGGARRYVSGGQFLATYGISVNKAKSYEAKWNQRAKLVEFSIA